VLIPAVDSGPWGYLTAFASVLILVDGLFLAFLLRVNRRGSQATLLWLLGPLLIGPLFLERFDLVAAALAASGLELLRRRPAVSAALLTSAAAIKLWPAVLLGLFLPYPDRLRRGAMTATACALGIVAVSAATGVLPAFWSAFVQQRDRGLQVEAVAAVPFLLAQAHPAFLHGSWEVTATGGELVALAVSVLGLLAAAGLLLRWRQLGVRGLPVDPALAGTTLTAVILVCDKALSPQYMIWMLACLAVASLQSFRNRTAITAMTLTACLLTQLVYPLQYTALLHGAVVPSVLLAVRDLLLASIAGLLVRASWTASESAV
jgi:hypothetical protein